MNVFKSGLKTLGKYIAATFSIYTITNFGKASIESFAQAEKSAMKLTTALKGNISQFKELEKVAKSRQAVTTFSDEETLDAMTRMRSILGDNMEAIKRLLPLVQDLAVVKEMNLSEAADLVAKSIATSTNALVRQGIEINGAAGSSERLESAVQALTKAFGGQAEALGNTLYGQLIKTKNAWDDIKEAIGAVLAKPLSKSAKAWQIWSETIMNPDASAWDKWAITFTRASELVEKYEEKYGKLAENLERIARIASIKINEDGTWIMPKGGITGTFGNEANKKPTGTPATKAFPMMSRAQIAINAGFANTYKYNPQSLNGTITSGNAPDVFETIRIKQKETAEANYEAMLEMERQTQQFADAIEATLEDLVISFAEAFGEMIASGKKANWGQVLSPVADAMSKLGKLIIVSAIALDELKKSLVKWASTNKVAAIAAGVALIATAAAIKAGISNIATGGGSGVASMQNQSGSREDYIFNRNLGDMAPIRVEVTGTIEGEVIRLANKRATIRHNNGY